MEMTTPLKESSIENQRGPKIIYFSLGNHITYVMFWEHVWGWDLEDVNSQKQYIIFLGIQKC